MSAEQLAPSPLPPVEHDCARGRHSELRECAPVEYGTCVNVDFVCVACKRTVKTVSWQKVAWLKRQREV